MESHRGQKRIQKLKRNGNWKERTPAAERPDAHAAIVDVCSSEAALVVQVSLCATIVQQTGVMQNAPELVTAMKSMRIMRMAPPLPSR